MGRPKGSTNKNRGLSSRKRVQFSLYPEDLQNIQTLINLEYGKNQSEVIRKILRETVEKEVRKAREKEVGTPDTPYFHPKYTNAVWES